MVANDEQLDQMPLNYREDIRSRVKECEIDLSDLNLTNLEGLEKISQKHCEVRRWFSFLADSPPKGSVTKLNISNNKLTQLNTALIKKAFPYIKKISADNNQVKELKFKDLTDLSCDSYVSLKNNQIISINFNGPTGLFNPEGCTVDISGSYLAQEEIELVRTKLFTNGTSLQLIPKKISSIWSNSVLQLWACITPIMGLVSIASPIKHPSGCDIENANLFNMLLSMSKYGNGYQKAFAGLGYLGIFYGVVGYAQFFSPVCNRVFNRPFVQSTLVAENQYPARQLLTKWAQRKSDGLVCLLDKKLDPALE